MQESIQAILERDPGNPLFAKHADDLRNSGALAEALQCCLKGLSHNPACHEGRLVLARIFFQQGFLPFAVREVQELRQLFPLSRSIEKLLMAMAPDIAVEVSGAEPAESSGAVPVVADETLAEADFDIEELELIEKEKKGLSE